jgi:hypothetical protein
VTLCAITFSLAALARVDFCWQHGALLSLTQKDDVARALVQVRCVVALTTHLDAHRLSQLDTRRRVVHFSVRARVPAALLEIISQALRSLLRSWYEVPHAIEIVCSHCLATCAKVREHVRASRHLSHRVYA